MDRTFAYISLRNGNCLLESIQFETQSERMVPPSEQTDRHRETDRKERMMYLGSRTKDSKTV